MSKPLTIGDVLRYQLGNVKADPRKCTHATKVFRGVEWRCKDCGAKC